MCRQELLDQVGLWAERLSAIMWISLPRGWLTTRSVRSATNSAEVCRAAVLPSTSPVFVLEPFLTNTPRSHWPQAIVIYHTGDTGGLVARLCAPGRYQPVKRTRRNALLQLDPG